MTFENTIRKNFVRYLVQKSIFCPVSGDVLDVRTCYVILDSDGDPAYVVSPEVGKRIEGMVADGVPALKEGYSIVPSSTF